MKNIIFQKFAKLIKFCKNCMKFDQNFMFFCLFFNFFAFFSLFFFLLVIDDRDDDGDIPYVSGRAKLSLKNSKKQLQNGTFGSQKWQKTC